MFATKKYVDNILKNNNLVANKALGQNFLIEDEIAKYITNNADVDKETFVIEIGPGLGALTEYLVTIAGMVRAFEIDSNMVKILEGAFKETNNFEIVNIDFLKVDFKKLIDDIHQLGYQKITVISNLPYYITAKLLSKVLINNYDIQSFVAMMQKEVGKKIIAPQKKDINQLSVILEYQYDVSVVKYVGKNSYLPRPNIDSIVLKFKKVDPKYSVSFEKIVNLSETLFMARRKTIYNNLKTIFTDQEKIIECLNKCNIDQNMHVEQLSFEQIFKLAKYI